ncbi:MAG: hypothetical protein DYH06_15270, partial [Acidobacteria bacterium ACB2]|nr:hypothetical protein [Acidobacteria bacterium ACB2]
APEGPKGLLARAARVAATTLAALVVLAATGAGGFWLHGRLFPEAPRYRGSLVLGGSVQALAPCVSPDGSRVAYVSSGAGVAQVGVLDPASGDWTVLTRASDRGSVDRVDWSSDGSRLYFDRVTDVPRGIFSVPAIGGDERLLLEDAQGPESLPDGSLLVTRVEGGRSFRLHRFQPETNELKPVGPPLLAESHRLALRSFPDGREAVVFGRLAEPGSPPERRLLVVDLAGGGARPFTSLPVVPPFCPTPDGREVLAVLRQGDVSQVVAVSRDGASFRTLLSFTSQPWYLGAAPDGTVWVALRESPGELLRVPESGGPPERIASTAASLAMTPVELTDGRLVVPALASGRRLLLAAAREGALKPLVETREWASPPVTTVGEGKLAFLLGGRDAPPVLAVASASDGRILERLPLPGTSAPKALAASASGETVYLAESGSVWAMDLASRKARKLCAGDGVALSPPTGTLVVQRNERDGVRCFDVLPDGSSEREILFRSADKVAPTPVSGRAVGPDGRILVTLAPAETGYWTPGILDPATAEVKRVPLRYEGDVLAASWSAAGEVLAMGVGQKGELWRFQRAD